VTERAPFDARVIRVLRRHRDQVARSTEWAYLALDRLGVREPAVLLIGAPPAQRAAEPADLRRRRRTG